MTGLLFWREAARKKIDFTDLRTFLANLPLDIELKAWIAAAPDEEIRSQLLKSISWECGALPLAPLADSVTNSVIVRCENYGILPSEAYRARDAMLVELLQSAAAPGERSLTRARLSEIIENATTIAVPAARLRSSIDRRIEAWDIAYQPPLHLQEQESDNGRLFFFASKNRVPFFGRQQELLALCRWLGERIDLSWTLLTGPGGAGKSRLALELCLYARKNGWSAGFLTRTSTVSEPGQFARFRPERPTLIVFDYVSEAPEKIGEIVRTLIDASILKRIQHPIRLLLIERSGEGSAWWSTFTEHDALLMKAYSACLGDKRRYLSLEGLDDNILWQIIQHVAGHEHASDRDRVIDALKQIDISGRPLFAALAADAIKNGRQIWQFSKTGLLSDILQREQRRWTALKRHKSELIAHENAAALATMVGGLRLPSESQPLSIQHFPFTDQCYNSELMAAICGLNQIGDLIPPIMPDAVGEWFVLQRLVKKHPFDERPEHLMRAAELRASLSPEDAALFRAFRCRAAEDFPEDVLKTDLFRAPLHFAAPYEVKEWAFSLAQGLRYSCINSPLAGELFTRLCQLRTGLDDEDIYLASADVYSAYAKMLSDEGRSESAFSLFVELLMLAQVRTDIPELGWAASDLGHRLGSDRVGMGDLGMAIEIFELLLDHARRFKVVDNAEKEEIAEDAASLGLSIRQEHIRMGNQGAAAILSKILWGSPPSNKPIDLGGRAALVMMERADDGDLGTRKQIYLELKARSRARPDAPEIAFFAANVAYGIVMSAEDVRQFVESILDLSEWLKEWADVPDMGDVTADAVNNEWITEDFQLGRKAVEALYELWIASLQAVFDRAGDTSSDNHLRATREDLERALSANEDSPWTNELRERIRVRHGEFVQLVEASRLPTMNQSD